MLMLGFLSSDKAARAVIPIEAIIFSTKNCFFSFSSIFLWFELPFSKSLYIGAPSMLYFFRVKYLFISCIDIAIGIVIKSPIILLALSIFFDFFTKSSKLELTFSFLNFRPKSTISRNKSDKLLPYFFLSPSNFNAFEQLVSSVIVL